VTAIGRPAVFERQISEAGADVKVSFRFADHHRYSSRDLAWIVEQAHARGVGAIVTTEKDWAKISGLSLPPARFCVARLSLEFIDGNPLECIRKAAE
jgi:tetraacyldisaccharide 4'-kinase